MFVIFKEKDGCFYYLLYIKCAAYLVLFIDLFTFILMNDERCQRFRINKLVKLMLPRLHAGLF